MVDKDYVDTCEDIGATELTIPSMEKNLIIFEAMGWMTGDPYALQRHTAVLAYFGNA